MALVLHLGKQYPLLRSDQYRPAVHGKTLFQQIRDLEKTSEWRAASDYWLNRLCCRKEGIQWKVNEKEPNNYSANLKVHELWFVQGYPRWNLPRLECEITGLFHYPDTRQLEIKFKLVREVMSLSQAQLDIYNRELGTFLERNRAEQAALIFTVPKGVGKK